MSDAVSVSNHDGVSVVTLQNPPVNGLGFAVRTSLRAALDAAAGDNSVRALVITGSGRMFSGGADIREFGQTPPDGTPPLPDLIDAIEASEKPVIAAIHGVALGGGCEVALGCHARLAAPGTRVGLPEVTLGILPGAGGTQRMPRLIGVPAALDLIVSGTMVPAPKALALGILDEIVDGDVVESAIALARRMVDDGVPIRRASALDDRIAEARGTPEIFDDFRKKMARRARGFEAPYACVDCIEAAVTQPFAEGLATERARFLTLVSSDQSKAQRHAFFAEREVAKIPDVPKDTPTRPIESAAVIGCGTMGGGIAMNFANAGIPVTVFEVSQEALDKGLGIIRKNYAATVSKGRLSQEQMDTRLGLISSTVDYADLANADVVIEAVFEDMALKKEVFGTLDATCKPEAILASNTSTLDVDEIAAATSRPEQVIGTHFFSPANDEADGKRARRQDGARHHRHHHETVEDDRESRRPGRHLRRLRREPDALRVSPAGRLPARRGGASASDRQGDLRLRHADGPLRHGRPGAVRRDDRPPGQPGVRKHGEHRLQKAQLHHLRAGVRKTKGALRKGGYHPARVDRRRADLHRLPLRLRKRRPAARQALGRSPL